MQLESYTTRGIQHHCDNKIKQFCNVEYLDRCLLTEPFMGVPVQFLLDSLSAYAIRYTRVFYILGAFDRNNRPSDIANNAVSLLPPHCSPTDYKACATVQGKMVHPDRGPCPLGDALARRRLQGPSSESQQHRSRHRSGSQGCYMSWDSRA